MIELFFKQNGIWHLNSLPYHLVSNGLVECAVQTIKSMESDERPLNTQLSGSFHMPETPHVTTGVSPAELLLHY